MKLYFNKIHTAVCLIILLIITSCGNKITPHLQSITIIVDGSDQEWDVNLYQTVSDNNIVYCHAIDEDHLNVLVKAMDRQSVMKVLMLGLTIWVDGNGKTNKKFGVKYPMGVQNPGGGELMQMMQSGQMNRTEGGRPNPSDADKEKLLAKLQTNKDNVGLIGMFDNSREVFLYSLSRLTIPLEIERKLNSAEELIIEYSIPLNLISLSNKKDLLSVGLEIEAIDVQQVMRQQMTQRGGAGVGRKMPVGMRAGRMRTGGIRGGSMSQKMQQMKELNQPIMEWSKIELK